MIRDLEYHFHVERLRVQPGEDSRNTLLWSFSTLSGLIRKKTAFLPGPVVTGQGTMILNWKRVGLDWIQGRNILMVGGGEIMGQVTQRGWATSPSFEVFKVSWMRFWAISSRSSGRRFCALQWRLNYVIFKGHFQSKQFYDFKYTAFYLLNVIELSTSHGHLQYRCLKLGELNPIHGIFNE